MRAPLFVLGILLAGAATPAGMAAQLALTVTNAPPLVDQMHLYASKGDFDGGGCPAEGRETSFAPVAGESVPIHVCVRVADRNGHHDVCEGLLREARSATLTVVGPDAERARGAGAAPLRCVHGDSTSATLVGSFTMEHWRTPSDAGGYSVAVALADETGARAEGTARFGYATLVAAQTRPCEAVPSCVVIVNEGNTDLVARIGTESLHVPVHPAGTGVAAPAAPGDELVVSARSMPRA